jgi:hypothetical protein
MNEGAIEVFHGKLVRVIREVTTAKCMIKPLTHTAHSANTRMYALASRKDQAPLELVDRDRGGRAPVIPFFPPSDLLSSTVWMSWFERWDRDEGGALHVRNVSATFYWGVANRKRKQLLRAEWDASDHSPVTAAQPHWQVDTELIGDAYMATVALPEMPSSDSLVELPLDDNGRELVELTPSGVHEISLSRLHLGMGGWQNASSHPACWKHNVGVNNSTLALWAERTLRHAADQFISLPDSVVTV